VKTPDFPASGPISSTAIPLAQLKRGDTAVVSGLVDVGLDSEQGSTLLARHRDLGFVAGARCEVIARMWPAGDPLVARVGGSTFALRRAEATAVRVVRLIDQPALHSSLLPKDARAATA
jgi:ferrous iron transport protein A